MKEKPFSEPWRYGFFQAVRVLRQLNPGRDPVGCDARPEEEVARFGAHASLGFPASEVHDITPPADDTSPPDVTVNFMGLTGPLGVLPRVYTEFLLQRASVDDFALRDFLNLFNHRAISLFYRAWEKYRFHLAYEQDKKAFLTQYLSDFIGIGTPGLQGNLEAPDEALLFYAGIFAQRPRSAHGLELILRDYFDLPVRIVQFSGRWIRLQEGDRSQLGVRQSSLGTNMILGENVYDRQSEFHVRLGPVPLPEFNRLLPCGTAFGALMQLIRFYVGVDLDFEVRIALKEDSLPPCILVSGGDGGVHLGWSSWIGIRNLGIDAEDTLLSCDAYEGVRGIGPKPEDQCQARELPGAEFD